MVLVAPARAASATVSSEKRPCAAAMIPRMRSAEKLSGQTLLIDADDTLWENNIYFERAIASFISFLNHHEFSPEQVRKVLNDVERECIITHGYGLHSFAHALVQTFERLSVPPVTAESHAQIQSFANTISNHAIELLPEVRETLSYLAQR